MGEKENHAGVGVKRLGDGMKSGPITKAIGDGLVLRAQLIADGTPEYEADRIVGQGLKAVLGVQRQWQYYCEHCRDTGFVNVEPSADELARITRLYGEHQQYRGYVVKCEPCRWTQLEREKRRKQLGQADEDDLVTAGQTKRRR